jgi:ammonia channel protein AmtB
VYTQRDRTRLKLTLRGKRLGLSLLEIRGLVDMYESPADTVSQLQAFLAVLAAHTHPQQRSEAVGIFRLWRDLGYAIGALLTGVLAYGPLSADAKNPDGVVIGGMTQFINQVIAVGATMIYTAIATFILLKIVDAIIGLRVTDEEEREGLDVVLHGERLG